MGAVLCDFWREEDAIGVVEIILILVVLIGLVISFKKPAGQSGKEYSFKNHKSKQQYLERRSMPCIRRESITVYLSLTLAHFGYR